MRSRWKIGGLLLLLLLVASMIGVPLAMRLRVELTPEPRWIVSADEIMHGSCAGAVGAQDFNIRPAENPDAAQISQTAAHRIADRAIVKQRGWVEYVGGLYGSDPILVHMTLPDGQERLAWARVWITDSGDTTLIGTGDIIYVDAQTGDPLVFVADVKIGDPNFGCGLGSRAVFDDMAAIAVPVVLVVYVILVAILGGILQFRQHAV